MRMNGKAAVAAALLLGGCAALLGGCATRGGVVLLPGAEGHPTGKLAVLRDDGGDAAVLDQGNSRVALGGHVTQRAVKKSGPTPAERQLLDALPEAEARFTLRFASEQDDIDPGDPVMVTLRAEVARRGAGVDVEVVGYTDASGPPGFDNLGLSQRRACNVLASLVKDGVLKPQYSACAGRGPAEPLAKPLDEEGHQPLNRRVEVVVR